MFSFVCIFSFLCVYLQSGSLMNGNRSNMRIYNYLFI